MRTLFFPMVVNPHSKAVHRWNKFFVIACLVAIFVDPLFFLLFSVDSVSILFLKHFLFHFIIWLSKLELAERFACERHGDRYPTSPMYKTTRLLFGDIQPCTSTYKYELHKNDMNIWWLFYNICMLLNQDEVGTSCGP